MNDQQMPHEPLRFRADDPNARARIIAAVDAVLDRDGEPPRLRFVLDGDALPSPTIAALVAGLRRVRERGGAIEVLPGTQPIRDALTLTGLNRVFAFPLVPDDRPPRRPRRLRRLARGIAGALAVGLGFGLLLSGPAAAQGTATDAQALLARVQARNPSLNTFQGRLHVDVAMKSFPFLHQHLDATTYYKRPANYEVVFDRVPSYASGFSKLFTDVGDPSHWNEHFVITPDGTAEFRGRKDVRLKLVQRVRGMIDHETVLIDPAAATIDQIEYDYYNGGKITMTQTFTAIGHYTMLAAQDAVIAIPHVRAVAHGEYRDYKTNVAIDDAVFTKHGS